MKIPENSALIVIDIVNSCAHQKCEIKKQGITFKKIRKMLPRLVKFIDYYKKKTKKPVIYISCVKWDKKHLAKNIVELYKDPACRYYTKDKSNFPEQFYLAKPEKDDIVITKNSYDAFTNPQLGKILKKKKIKYLIITGIFSDGCVNATIVNGFSKGYNFVILKDLVETRDDRKSQALQKLLIEQNWRLMYGKTISSKELKF